MFPAIDDAKLTELSHRFNSDSEQIVHYLLENPSQAEGTSDAQQQQQATIEARELPACSPTPISNAAPPTPCAVAGAVTVSSTRMTSGYLPLDIAVTEVCLWCSAVLVGLQVLIERLDGRFCASFHKPPWNKRVSVLQSTPTTYKRRSSMREYLLLLSLQSHHSHLQYTPSSPLLHLLLSLSPQHRYRRNQSVCLPWMAIAQTLPPRPAQQSATTKQRLPPLYLPLRVCKCSATRGGTGRRRRGGHWQHC
jgi:hypothetical protein